MSKYSPPFAIPWIVSDLNYLDVTWKMRREVCDHGTAGGTLKESIKHNPNISAQRTNSAIGFNPDDSANAVCACHVWRSTEMTWNVPAYQQIFSKLANPAVIECPTDHFCSLDTMLKTRPPNHLRSWNSFSFVLKVNKTGQQCKYFHSRKWSQTHRCTAEAERGGNMVLAPEDACAIFPLSWSFEFNVSGCRQIRTE